LKKTFQNPRGKIALFLACIAFLISLCSIIVLSVVNREQGKSKKAAKKEAREAAKAAKKEERKTTVVKLPFPKFVNCLVM
jgi:hypothetical protein